ncbi:MAG: rod shape-determining protein MreC [Dehalococcoidia bacterium]
MELLRADEGESKILATVVHRDGSTFADTISIDRGSNDGIEEGMVVLSAQGSLLGSVTSALPGQSFVRLVTDSRSRVAGQATQSQAEGVVSGELGGGLTLALARAEVQVGDLIVTSGIGGGYPQGIPIATVSSVEGSAQELFRNVKLEPLVRPSTVRTVIVLLGTPALAEGGSP